MKRFRFAPLLIFLAILTQLSCNPRTSTRSRATASPSPTEQAEIDQILQRYEQAIGGQDAINAITTYRVKGTFELAGTTGTLEGWRKEPDKTLSVMQFSRGGTLKNGFDGQTRWVQTPAGTFTDSSTQEIAKLERDLEIYGVAKIRSMFETMKLDYKARLSGREMHVIEGKPAKGPAEKLFFDVENGLLARWDMARREPKRGTVFVKVHLNDYKDVSGVKVPFNVRFAFESFNMIVKIEELEHNIPIDDAIFRKP